jgi:hypothetical protein
MGLWVLSPPGGVEWVWNGLEWFGMDWNALKWFGMLWIGMGFVTG